MKKQNILVWVILVAVVLFTVYKPTTPTQAQVPITSNLVQNPSFDQGTTGWDMRPGKGPTGGDLGVIDTTVYHSSPSSLKIPPSNYADGDRSIWQSYRIDVSAYRGKQIRLSGYVRHDTCSGAPNAPCWVNPTYAGNTVLTNWDCCTLLGVCQNPAHFQGPWCGITDRGGARLGIDFRQGETMFKEYVVISDWTTANNQWQYVELITDVPLNYVPPGLSTTYNADTVIVWIQGFEYNAPAAVYLDDVEVVILGQSTTECNTIADLVPCDGLVSRSELGTAITKWVNSQITRTELGQAIAAWAGG